MEKLLKIGNKYAEESDWTDFALVKICLGSLGVIVGTFISDGKKGIARVAAFATFMATYIPLMVRTFETVKMVLKRDK